MKLILVGGFLGAGKTTLLWECARELAQRGHLVGLITNDQAPDLVDTALLSRSTGKVREVAGSCFCCNFPGFEKAIHSLIDEGANYIIAEPVGSCTDLSATILQPLKQHYPAYHVAPLTILADPFRIQETLQEQHPLLHADAIYILHKQMEEADRILLNKTDLLSPEEQKKVISFLKDHFPDSRISMLSALTGHGVSEWLDDILSDMTSGTRITNVDYDRYANGEAVLGWLNTVIDLRWISDTEPDWETIAKRLLTTLQNHFHSARNEIGHIKLILECAPERVIANLTGTNGRIVLLNEAKGSGTNASLTVNARVQMSPDEIEILFRKTLNEITQSYAIPTIKAFYCLKPGRPQPTYRYDTVAQTGNTREHLSYDSHES